MRQIQYNQRLVYKTNSALLRPALGLAIVLTLPVQAVLAQSTNPTLQEVEVADRAENNNTPEVPQISSNIETDGEILETKKLQSLSELSQQVPGFYGFGSTPMAGGLPRLSLTNRSLILRLFQRPLG